VSRRFGSTVALDGVTLEFPPRSLTAVLGPSGCGKSTLLRLLAGLDDPDAGTVHVGGVEVANPRSRVAPERRGVSLVFQDLALWPHMTVRGNIEFPLETRVPDRAQRTRKVEEAAALARITHRLDAAPSTLSGGERQRAALARALAGEPGLLLLDEPFAGLDPALRLHLLEAVAEVRARLGIAAILVTHDQQEALGAADRVVVMRRGQVVRQGAAAEVYDRPGSAFVASFVGLASFLRGTAAGDGSVRTEAGSVVVDDAPEGEALVAFRPEDLALDADGPLRGTAGRALYRGDDWVLTVETASGRLMVRCNRPTAAGAEVRIRPLRNGRVVKDDREETP
jgi:iron(III) transport system ATP-binding protein